MTVILSSPQVRRRSRSFQSLTLAGSLLALAVISACWVKVSGDAAPSQQLAGRILLSPTDTLPLIRLGMVHFEDGTPPSVQLEYEAPFAISDAQAAQREARRLWPLLLPYVAAERVTSAVITAANTRQTQSSMFSWTKTIVSFGIIIRKTPKGWMIEGDSDPLPDADPKSLPPIQTPSGEPLLPGHLGA